PLAEHVRERLAGAPPAHELTGRRQLRIRQRPVVLEGQIETGEAERLRDEVLAVDSRARNALAGQVRGRRLQDVADRHATVSSALRRSSAASAWVKSPRSPSRIWSSRCCVSLMRWSVTRPSA